MSKSRRAWACSISLLAACTQADESVETSLYAADTQATGWGEDDGEIDPEAACIIDGELMRPLWTADSTNGGQLRLLQVGAAPLELSIPGLNSWVSVDVSRTHVVAGYRAGETAIVRLFARETGEQIWERSYPGSTIGSNSFVDDRGRALVSYGDTTGASLGFKGGLWLRAEGDRELPWSRPAGPLDAHDWAPAFFLDPASQSISDQQLTGWGWVAPSNGARLILSEEIFSPPFMLIEDGAFEYIDGDSEAGFRLLHAGFEAARWIPLPGAQFASMITYSDRHRLIDLWWSDDHTSLARVSIVDGELLEFNLPGPPADFELLDCKRLHPGIDSLGRLLIPVRDESSVRIGAWDPETDEWSLIGLPMVDVDYVQFSEARGAFVVVWAGGQGNCEQAPFVDPPADAVIGDHSQLVGVESGLAVESGPGVQIDDQQVCATWTSLDARIVLDLEDGDQLVLPPGTNAGWFD